MNFNIVQEPMVICCDNYNEKECSVLDSSICIDCEDRCEESAYLIKFMLDDQIIHQYKRYSELDVWDIEEMKKCLEKLSYHL